MQLVVRARLSRFLKADDRTQLAVEKRQVNRGGKTFEQGFHVKPEDSTAKTPPAPGESLFTKRPMPQMTLTSQDYRFIGNVAKLMGMTIPTREAQSAQTINAMKKRLDEGIAKGWKLKFGDINAMSTQLGQIAQRMEAKGGKGVVMKASSYRHWLRLNPKLKKRKRLVVRNGKAYYRDTYTKQEPPKDQSPEVAKSLVSDAMSAEKAKYGKPKKARIKKHRVMKASQYTHPERKTVGGKHPHQQTYHVGKKPQDAEPQMQTDYWKRREEKYLKRSAASKKAYATVQKRRAEAGKTWAEVQKLPGVQVGFIGATMRDIVSFDTKKTTPEDMKAALADGYDLIRLSDEDARFTSVLKDAGFRYSEEKRRWDRLPAKGDIGTLLMEANKRAGLPARATMEQIRAHHNSTGSKADMLNSIYGRTLAHYVLRELEVQSWKGEGKNLGKDEDPEIADKMRAVAKQGKAAVQKMSKAGRYTHPEKRPVQGKHGIHYQTYHVGTAPKEWKLNAINPKDIEEVEYAPGRKAYQLKGNTRTLGMKKTAEEILRNHVASQVYDKVSAALKTVKSSSYNLSREEDWRRMHADQWKALQDALPGLPLTQNEFLQIENRHMNKESGGTAMDIWDDIAEKIVRNMEKR